MLNEEMFLITQDCNSKANNACFNLFEAFKSKINVCKVNVCNIIRPNFHGPLMTLIGLPILTSSYHMVERRVTRLGGISST